MEKKTQRMKKILISIMIDGFPSRKLNLIELNKFIDFELIFLGVTP